MKDESSLIPRQEASRNEQAAPQKETGGLSIRYLGQVGFLLQRNGISIVIDPFLSEPASSPGSIWIRSYPPPVLPEVLREVDLVLCTHDHADHTDPESLLGIRAASPACRFAGPRISAREMARAGIPVDRITVLNEGISLPLGGLMVEPVAAAHEDYETDEESYHRYLGYLLHWDGITVYHAGDTVITPKLERTLSLHRIDIGFLPINGRDRKRRRQDIVGNMNASEALRLATRLERRRGFHLLVPTHYDLYKCNGAELGDFVGLWDKTSAPKPAFKILQPGEEFDYRQGRVLR